MERISLLFVAAVSCFLLASVTCKPAGNAVNNGVDLEIREAELTLLRSLLEAEKRTPKDIPPPSEGTPDFDEPQPDIGLFDDVDAIDEADENNADGEVSDHEADGNSINETNENEAPGTASEEEDNENEAPGTANEEEDNENEAPGTASEEKDNENEAGEDVINDGTNENEAAGTASEEEDDGNEADGDVINDGTDENEAAGTASEEEDDGDKDDGDVINDGAEESEAAGTDANADEITDAKAGEEEVSNESEEEPVIAVSVSSEGHSEGHPSSGAAQNETQPDDSVEDDVNNDHKRIMAYLYGLINDIKKEITKGDLHSAINKIDMAKMEVDGYLWTLQISQKQAEKYQAKVERISNLLEAGMDQLLNEIVKENSSDQESPAVNDDGEQAPPATPNEEDNEPATPNVEDSQPTPSEENGSKPEEEDVDVEDVAQAGEFRRALELLKTLKKIRSELNIQKDIN